MVSSGVISDPLLASHYLAGWPAPRECQQALP